MGQNSSSESQTTFPPPPSSKNYRHLLPINTKSQVDSFSCSELQLQQSSSSQNQTTTIPKKITVVKISNDGRYVCTLNHRTDYHLVTPSSSASSWLTITCVQYDDNNKSQQQQQQKSKQQEENEVCCIVLPFSTSNSLDTTPLSSMNRNKNSKFGDFFGQEFCFHPQNSMNFACTVVDQIHGTGWICCYRVMGGIPILGAEFTHSFSCSLTLQENVMFEFHPTRADIILVGTKTEFMIYDILECSSTRCLMSLGGQLLYHPVLQSLSNATNSGHRGYLTAFAASPSFFSTSSFSYSGYYVLSAASDGQLKIWKRPNIRKKISLLLKSVEGNSQLKEMKEDVATCCLVAASSDSSEDDQIKLDCNWAISISFADNSNLVAISTYYNIYFYTLYATSKSFLALLPATILPITLPERPIFPRNNSFRPSCVNISNVSDQKKGSSLVTQATTSSENNNNNNSSSSFSVLKQSKFLPQSNGMIICTFLKQEERIAFFSVLTGQEIPVVVDDDDEVKSFPFLSSEFSVNAFLKKKNNEKKTSSKITRPKKKNTTSLRDFFSTHEFSVSKNSVAVKCSRTLNDDDDDDANEVEDDEKCDYIKIFYLKKSVIRFHAKLPMFMVEKLSTTTIRFCLQEYKVRFGVMNYL